MCLVVPFEDSADVCAPTQKHPVCARRLPTYHANSNKKRQLDTSAVSAAGWSRQGASVVRAQCNCSLLFEREPVIGDEQATDVVRPLWLDSGGLFYA